MSYSLLRKILPGMLTLLFLGITCSPTHAQNMTGATSAQYAGICSAQLNPATLVLSPLYIDISLASAEVFVENNYIFMPREDNKLRRFFKSDHPIVNAGPDKTYADYYTDSWKVGQMQARVSGPSLALVAGKHAFGITTAVRSVTSVRDMPHTLAKFFYEGLYFPPQYDTRYAYQHQVSIASLNWAEAGLTYSGMIRCREKDIWCGGVTVKRLLGYAGAYMDMDKLDYMVPDHDTLIVYHADLEAGVALPMDYYNNEYLTEPLVRGKGLGVDLGFVWERKLRVPTDASYYRQLCGQQYVPYLFRLGASLLDLGSIRFTENAERLGVNDGQLFWPGLGDLEYTNLHDLSHQVSEHFYGDPESLVRGSAFTMGLPAQVTLQGDFNLTAILTGRSSESYTERGSRNAAGSGYLRWLGGPGSWYVNAVATIPVNRANASVMQPLMLAVGTRYESPHFQLGVTGSFYDHRYFHLGVNGRFRFLFVGTDNLLSFLRVNDYTGTSLYAGLRISLRKGSCRQRGFQCPDLF